MPLPDMQTCEGQGGGCQDWRLVMRGGHVLCLVIGVAVGYWVLPRLMVKKR